MTESEDKLRALSRWSVAFTGTPVQAAFAALESQGIGVISAGAHFPAVTPGPEFKHHRAVGVHALSAEDALAKVKSIVEPVGDFDDFTVEPLTPADDGDDDGAA